MRPNMKNEMPDSVEHWLKGASYEADFECILPWIRIKIPNGATSKLVEYRGRAKCDLVQCLFDKIARDAQKGSKQ